MPIGRRLQGCRTTKKGASTQTAARARPHTYSSLLSTSSCIATHAAKESAPAAKHRIAGRWISARVAKQAATGPWRMHSPGRGLGGKDRQGVASRDGRATKEVAAIALAHLQRVLRASKQIIAGRSGSARKRQGAGGLALRLLPELVEARLAATAKQILTLVWGLVL